MNAECGMKDVLTPDNVPSPFQIPHSAFAIRHSRLWRGYSRAWVPSHHGLLPLRWHWQTAFLPGASTSQTIGAIPVPIRLWVPSQYGSFADHPHWQ